MKPPRIRPDEQFARLLEVTAPTTVDVDPAMGSMLRVTLALRAAGHTQGLTAPDPDFRAALRQRLVAVAAVQATEIAAAPHHTPQRAFEALGQRTRRRITALAGTFAIATSVAGVGVAAAHSLPGDPFYGVKRTTESVQLWATRGDDAKGKRHLEFARERLAEITALPAGSSQIASTLAAMDSQTTQGTQELIAAYQSSHSTVPLSDLLAFSRQQVTGLRQLTATLPLTVRNQELHSIGVVTAVVNQVHQVAPGVCVLCAPSPNTRTPGGGHSTSPAPNPSPSSHRSKHPTNPNGGASSPATRPSSSAPGPKKSGLPTPPTSILPTKHLPTGGLTSILHLQGSSKPTKNPKPLPVVSSILGSLGL
jgi:hypothetical protein